MNTPPNTSLTTLSHDAMEQAAAWFSLLQSGAATDADRARWQDWLASGADQRAAWAFVERVSQRFQPLHPHADTGTAVPRLAADALQAAASNRRHRRTVLGIAAMAGTGGLLGWAAWGQSGAIDALLAWGADHRTATGQRREVRLPEGTQVWLGSASAFNQDYDTRLRRLRLHGGEILIQTATDADRRPFVVDTPQGRMQALGTHFNVRLDEDGRTQLAVYQGAVQVTLAHSAESATIGAGQQLGFSARRLDAPAPADPARQAWARGILLAQDIPLGQVIAELARYQRGHIAVAPEVAGLTVLGSYPLDDVDGTLSMLQQTLPIQVRHPLPWWTTIEARGR